MKIVNCMKSVLSSILATSIPSAWCFGQSQRTLLV
jgi:hypothetical protein